MWYFLTAVALLVVLPLAVYAASNDNNVEWNGTGHIPGNNICGDSNFPYRNPLNNTNQAVTIRARVYKGDVTAITVWYTTNSSASQQAHWSSVSGSWTNNWNNCGGITNNDMDIWKATIPAQSGTVYYKIAITDGTDTDWQRASGEGGTGMYSDDGGWATSSTSLSYAGTLAVTLADFHAAQQGDAVLVTWETASELNNRGFNLYRGVSPDGWDRRLNEHLIPSQSQGSPGGFVYTWEDDAELVPGTSYFYWVSDVDLSGVETMHGPVSVDFVVPTAVTLSSVSASPAAGAAALPWLWIVAAAGAALGAGRLRRRG